LEKPLNGGFTVDLSSLVLGVEAYTQQHLTQYIEELRELCAIDSDSYNKAGLDEMAVYLAARMRGLKMDVTLIEHKNWGNDVLGVLRGDGSGRVMLLGHTDTVYPLGTAEARPLRVEGDMIYGPGVCDMKGCILSAIYGIEALVTMGYRSFGEVRFLCVSDEEIHERHSEEVIQQVCQGCEGALVLEAARANGDIVSARKGNAYYTLTARGRSAHAGVEPEKGRNAILELAYQVGQFQSLNGWREGITINPGVISGGTAPNVVPDYAQVRLDMRFLNVADRIATEERWQQMIKHPYIDGVELTLERDPDDKNPMLCTPASMQMVQQAQRIANLLGFSIGHVLTGGSSDASYTTDFGVPTLDGLGPIGGRDHSPNEYLMANSVAPRTALLAGLIATLGA
jgi:glutamate carboxypeptidase